MKHEIEIGDNDLLWDYGQDLKLPFCVSMEKDNPYYDNDNYTRNRRDGPEILRAETIEELYEKMGQEVVDHLLYGETQSKSQWPHTPKDGWDVNFSNIFIEVEYYSKDKMRASKKFQEIGLVRELKAKQEEERQCIERARVAAWNAEQKEKHDREEYLRLSKKFNNA